MNHYCRWILFVLVILVGTASGCSEKNTVSTSTIDIKDDTYGNYEKEKVEIEPVAAVLQDPNQFGIYTYRNDQLECKVYSNGESESVSCTWYPELARQDYYFSTIIQGFNQNQYVLVMDHDFNMKLYAIKDNDDITECKVKLANIQEETIANIQILGDGLVTYQKADGIYGYSMQGKEEMYLKGYSSYCTDGKDIYAYNIAENQMDQISASGKLLKKYSFNNNPNLIKMIGCDEGKVYILTENGLYAIDLESLNCEIVLERDLLIENSELMMNVSLVHGKEKPIEFYAVYNVNDNNQVCYRYIYTPEKKKSIKKNVLTIYGIDKDNFIQKAIDIYRRQNTEVEINYVVKDDDISNQDIIKKWNTELIAGNGADLYCMRYLPEQDFIEKGILVNLSDVILPLAERGDLIPNVADNYMKMEKVYTIAPRIQIPVIFGKREVIESLQNLNSLYDYIQAHSMEQLFPEIPAYYVGLMLFDLYQDEIVQDQVEEQAFDKCTRIIDQIKACQNEDESDQIAGYTYGNPEYTLALGFGDYFIDPNDTKTRIVQLASWKEEPTNLFQLATAKNKSHMSIGTFHNGYVECSKIGMNAASKNQEVAKEFLTFLLSEKAQCIDSYSGFPINQKAFDQCFDSKYYNGRQILEGNGSGKSYDKPTQELLNELKKMISGLEKPIHYDNRAREIILDAFREDDSRYDMEKIKMFINNRLQLQAEE